MAIANNTQRSLVIAARTEGYDPAGVVADGNLMKSPENVNAFVGLPDGNKPVHQIKPPAPDPGRIPEIKKPSNPYPGFGGTEG